jgi:type IV pilus assembly protein PilC
MLFGYKAVDRDGKMVVGSYEAADKNQVIAHIKAQQMTPVSITTGRSTDFKEMLPKRKTKAKDMSMFCEQFCSLLRAGVTILDALKLLADQVKDRALQEGVQNTIIGVNEGESLGDAMSKSPVFDATFVNLVRAGEASGSLDQSLERMGVQYDKDAKIAAATKKALTYPIIVLIVAVVVVIVMLVYIVPMYTKMFAEVGIEMPKITLMVMAASEWMVQNYLIVILALVGFVIAIISFFKSATGKQVSSWIVLNVPVVKDFVIKSNASKIARTLSTLLTAGMTVIEALAILETTLNNYYYKQSIASIKNEVLNGQPMAKLFAADPKLFPPMLSHMIAVGEDTGEISSMLTRTADYYDLEVETATDTLMSMMSPAIIILLTGVVGVLIAAVFAPMLAMYDQLGDAL